MRAACGQSDSNKLTFSQRFPPPLAIPSDKNHFPETKEGSCTQRVGIMQQGIINEVVHLARLSPHPRASQGTLRGSHRPQRSLAKTVRGMVLQSRLIQGCGSTLTRKSPGSQALGAFFNQGRIG